MGFFVGSNSSLLLQISNSTLHGSVFKMWKHEILKLRMTLGGVDKLGKMVFSLVL